MSLKVRLASKRKPAGWELVEPTLLQFEERLREAVDDPHEGKRKCESSWPIHRIHYERNRFVYDLHYKQQKISKELYEFMVREKMADFAITEDSDLIAFGCPRVVLKMNWNGFGQLFDIESFRKNDAGGKAWERLVQCVWPPRGNGYFCHPGAQVGIWAAL